jgi:hypothetical protein
MRGLSLVTFLLLSVYAQAQMRECRILSTESIPFYLEVDGTILADSALISYDFAAQNASLSIEIAQLDSTGLTLSSTIEPEENMLTVYDLRRVKGSLILLESSRTSLLPTNLATDELINVTDSLADSLAPVQKIDPGFQNMLTKLGNEFFESEKQKLVIEYIKGHQISTSQLSVFLSYFEFEDRKLTIISSARPQVSDFDKNWSALKSSFVLKTSLQALSDMASGS